MLNQLIHYCLSYDIGNVMMLILMLRKHASVQYESFAPVNYKKAYCPTIMLIFI